MKTLVILTNGIVVLSSPTCASRLCGTNWKTNPARRLTVTFLIIGATIAISLSQFVWPELITTLA